MSREKHLINIRRNAWNYNVDDLLKCEKNFQVTIQMLSARDIGHDWNTTVSVISLGNILNKTKFGKVEISENKKTNFYWLQET